MTRRLENCKSGFIHVTDSAAHDLALGESASMRVRSSVSVWLVVIALTAIWFALAAGRALIHPDEGRYAEIPREMLTTGDWVTPHVNGLAYLEKPPLQYWTTAVAYRLFGINEWSARLSTMLSGWCTVAMVFLLGRSIWNTRTGVLAAAFLASTVLFFVLGQILTLDMAFTCMMTAMLCAFCMAQLRRHSAPRASRTWILVSWALLGLATLTKGIVAEVIAGSVLSIYILWQRDWMAWRTLRPGWGLGILALITVPWFILASRADADFLRFFIVHEHFQRYLTSEAHHLHPWWYFLAIVAVGVLPWLPQMARALMLGWRSSTAVGRFDVRRLLWVWCMFILAFFSVSHSKLAPYVLPILPPLSLLAAAQESSRALRGLTLNVWIVLTVAAALTAGLWVAPSVSGDPVTVLAADAARPAVLIFAALAVMAVTLCRPAVVRSRPLKAIVTMAIVWFLGLSLLFATIARVDTLRSGRGLAAQIPPELAASVPIFSVATFDQTLPFYLRRTMILVDYRGELDYGLRHAPAGGIDEARDFEQLWRDLPEGIAIMKHATYSRLAGRGVPMRILGTDRRRVAVSRR